MFVLFESSAGYSLFKTTKEALADDLVESDFSEDPSRFVSLVAFDKFLDSSEAIRACTAIVQGELEKPLSKFIKSHLKKSDTLAVSDSKLGQAIKAKLEIDCVVAKLGVVRGIRQNLGQLIPTLKEKDAVQMQLTSAHNLGRYKLRFSPDKVDTMIVQAIGLLDELDKEINTYAMRVREWYGWHFPEMAKIVTDGIQYSKVVRKSRLRNEMKKLDFSDILQNEEVEEKLKQVAEISMGTDVSEEDLDCICNLADQVIEMSAYRSQLSDYLKNRMNCIAPNLTVMLGELVGARLIAHAGSLLNLAKAPASTVQILGAEKALFRALKTKHDTPKYGLIYHASLIGQASQKNKGKIARVLAAKSTIAIRVDALGEREDCDVAMECRQKVEARLRQLESGEAYVKPQPVVKDQARKSISVAPPQYNPSADVTVTTSGKKKRKMSDEEQVVVEEEEKPKKKKERKSDFVAEEEDDEAARKKAKKEKKEKKRAKAAEDEE
ncbi:hypothetical protein BASA81_016257 [Batrachochytrium salamandrivorans]|nr:hypothetical protein BASA81_016257 [Batrachochytrium salamandrivorans]